jgi:hypothetical protein
VDQGAGGGLGHRGIECAFGVVAAVAASLLISRASVVEMKPTDPAIELLRQARQAPRWHSKQGVDLVRGQLNSDLKTGAGGIPKELPPKTGVRQQSAERTFHVSLAHASARGKDRTMRLCSVSAKASCFFARQCANPHANVEQRTTPTLLT